MMNYVNSAIVTGIAAGAAAVIGVILYFTFFSRKNEDRFHGLKGKLYNMMTFNRFYAEDLLKFVYIAAAFAVTAAGLANIVLGSFLFGITLIIAVNLILRLGFELLMMFIMLCRKTVAMDRKLARIANYYDDGYGGFDGEGGVREMTREEWEAANFGEEVDGGCSGECGSCGVEDCGSIADEDIDNLVYEIKNGQ